MTSKILAALSVLVVSAAAVEQKPAEKSAAEGLVTVTVKGTSIDSLPLEVDVLVADPAKEVGILLRKGAEKFANAPTAVMYRGVRYFFMKSDNWNPGMRGRTLANGDVAYLYRAESPKAEGDFATEYGLKKHAILKTTSGDKTLYVASPGYYVFFLVKREVYVCPMHANVVEKQKGQCPTCGMDLVSTTIYE